MDGRGGSAVVGSGAAGAAGIMGAGAIVAHPPASNDAATQRMRKPFIARSREVLESERDAPKADENASAGTSLTNNLEGSERVEF